MTISHNASQLDVGRLRKVWALTTSPNKHEAATARVKARLMLAQFGKTLADVPGLLAPPAPAAFRVMGDFGDYMEKQEPGWMAREAARWVDKAQAEAKERATVIAFYGSEEAALAPIAIEAAVEKAVHVLERKVMKKYANGTFETDSLDGWTGGLFGDEMPRHVRAALEWALPLPVTIVDAKAEYLLWEARDRELGLIYENTGDTQLSLACGARQDIVRRLLETGLRATSWADVLTRRHYLVDLEYRIDGGDKAVLADLETLVEAADGH